MEGWAFYKFGSRPRYLVHRVMFESPRTLCGQRTYPKSAPIEVRERYCHPCKVRFRRLHPEEALAELYGARITSPEVITFAWRAHSGLLA